MALLLDVMLCFQYVVSMQRFQLMHATKELKASEL